MLGTRRCLILLSTCLCVSGSRSQQLCVKLEPRGLLYVKLSLQEKWDTHVRKSTTSTANESAETKQAQSLRVKQHGIPPYDTVTGC